MCLITLAIILTPKLARLKINRAARYAFATMMVSLGTYMAVISNLFFNDALPSSNYSAELISVRVLALVASVWFLIAAYRCNP